MSFVVTETKNDIFKITLNRPEVRNAFHPEMIQQLTDAFLKAQNAEANMVFLSGAGKSFCAGADLDWMKSMKGYTLEENQKDSEKLFEMFEAARNCNLPVLGKLHGHVMGGATGLAAICDFAAATEETKFCFSEVKLGLVPAVISPFVLRKMQIGPAKAFMISGKMFTSAEARQAGLINFSGDMASVNQYLGDIAENLMASGREAVMATKKLINQVSQPMWNGIKQETASVIAERRVSEEGQQGLGAFFNKSAPPWKRSFNGEF